MVLNVEEIVAQEAEVRFLQRLEALRLTRFFPSLHILLARFSFHEEEKSDITMARRSNRSIWRLAMIDRDLNIHYNDFILSRRPDERAAKLPDPQPYAHTTTCFV